MSTLSRRTTLRGLGAAVAATLLTPALAKPATASASGFATVIVGPHADDFYLRLSGYIITAADRGDATAAITLTDGAATSVGTKLGLTPAQVARIRLREDQHAWDHLTDSRGGTVTNLGLPDGSVTAQAAYNAIVARLSGMPGKPEAYLAVYPPDRTYAYVPSPTGGDAHPDHVALVHAGAMLASDGVTVRYAVHPSQAHRTGGTMAYDINDRQFLRVEAAGASYRTIGQRSVPAQFRHVLDAHGRTVIVRPR